MTEPTPDPKPRRKRGPKPAADLDAVTRVGAEFRAIWPLCDTTPDKTVAKMVVDSPVNFTRLASACADLSEEQRPLAVALCKALAESK